MIKEGTVNECSDDQDATEGGGNREDIVVEDYAPATIRMIGQIFGDQLKEAMPN